MMVCSEYDVTNQRKITRDTWAFSFVWDKSMGEPFAGWVGGSCEVTQTISIMDAAIDQALHRIDAFPRLEILPDGTYELSVN
jgi:hypothetical protein